jgi:uncharacterized membrane protein HdeD (DUF308 family)
MRYRYSRHQSWKILLAGVVYFALGIPAAFILFSSYPAAIHHWSGWIFLLIPIVGAISLIFGLKLLKSPGRPEYLPKANWQKKLEKFVWRNRHG